MLSQSDPISPSQGLELQQSHVIRAKYLRKSYFRVRGTPAMICFKAFTAKLFYKTHPLLKAIENR